MFFIYSFIYFYFVCVQGCAVVHLAEEVRGQLWELVPSFFRRWSDLMANTVFTH